MGFLYSFVFSLGLTMAFMSVVQPVFQSTPLLHQALYATIGDLFKTQVKIPIPNGLEQHATDFWGALTNNPLPSSESDIFIFWTGDAAQEKLQKLHSILTTKNPGVTVQTSLHAKLHWIKYFWKYDNAVRLAKVEEMSWQSWAILSIKYSELAANHVQPVHILYSQFGENSTRNDIPRGRHLTDFELPILTAPGSRVPEIFRWEVSTLGESSVCSAPISIWKKGDPQLSFLETNLTKNPSFEREREEKAKQEETDRRFAECKRKWLEEWSEAEFNWMVMRGMACEEYSGL